MSGLNVFVVAACVALAALLAPVRMWQNWLLWAFSLALRLTGTVAVAAAAGLYFAGDTALPEVRSTLGGLQGTEPLALAALAVGLLFPLVTFLDFSRRLDHSTQDVESLLDALREASGLMQCCLDQSRAPGASLTPERRAELSSALGALRGTPPREPPIVRATLAELVK